MINVCRLRAGDEITLSSGEKLLIEEAWNANGIFQFKVTGGDIVSVDINGKSIEGKSDIESFIENETEADKITYYLPHFDVDMLPILTINGQDRIIYQLMELNGLEIEGKQTLKASYKPVIIASLEKKLGRDTEVLKVEKIICETREECEKKLMQIAGNIKGANLDETETKKEFDNLIKKVLTY